MSQSLHAAHHHPAEHPVDNYQLENSRWAAGRNTLFFAVIISVALCVLGYVQDPERFFRSYTVAFAFTAASVTVRRIMENIMITLPIGAILFLPLIFGLKHVYPWTHPDIVSASEAL